MGHRERPRPAGAHTWYVCRGTLALTRDECNRVSRLVNYLRAALSILSKIGVPTPVTGSQPLVQLKPYGVVYGPLPRRLSPLVMSVKLSVFW